MFKKLKSLIIAVLVTAIFPTFRIPGNESPAPEANNQDPNTNNQKITGEQTPKANTLQGPALEIKDLQAQLSAKDSALTLAKETITKNQETITNLEKTAGETVARLNELDGSLKKTVAGYRALVLQSNPEILPELIAGDTLEALDSSLAKAKNLTNKIKAGLQAQARNQRVPAGAPPRGPEDLSGLSSTEKIRQGLTRK